VAELPNVVAAYKKLHAKGFEIIGISLDNEKKETLDKFLATHPDMKWPQVYDGKGWKAELAVLYEVKSIPATYLLDREGKVYRTGLRGKALERAVEKLLARGATASKGD
jgi:peroxiredoxin